MFTYMHQRTYLPLPTYINAPTYLYLLPNPCQPTIIYLPLPIPKYQYIIAAHPGAGMDLVLRKNDNFHFTFSKACIDK